MSNQLFDINTIYCGHVQDVGWEPEVRNGMNAGTTGQNKRLEAFKLKLEVPDGKEVKVMKRAHVQDLGWLDPVYGDDDVCGTVGLGKELQAIQLQLYGKDADQYEIWFQLHVQNKGWMNWMSGGELAGTVGLALQAEAIRVMVFAKGISLKTDGVAGFVEYVAPPAKDPIVNPDMAGKYFSWAELACDCIKPEYGFGWCDGYPEQDLKNQNAPYLIDILDRLREYLGAMIIVTSMIRCQDCNDYWGGIPGSYHTTWQAVDIVVPGFSPYEVAVAANELTGCGARYYRASGFTHLEPPGCGVYCQE